MQKIFGAATVLACAVAAVVLGRVKPVDAEGLYISLGVGATEAAAGPLGSRSTVIDATAVGQVFKLQVFADVYGNDADGNNEGLQELNFSLVNSTLGTTGTSISPFRLTAPFNAEGSTAGAAFTVTTNGVANVNRGVASGLSGTSYIFTRAASPQINSVVAAESAFFGTSNTLPGTTISNSNGNGSEFYLGSATITIMHLGSDTSFNAVPELLADGSPFQDAALWEEDAQFTLEANGNPYFTTIGSNPVDPPFAGGTPISVIDVVGDFTWTGAAGNTWDTASGMNWTNASAAKVYANYADPTNPNTAIFNLAASAAVAVDGNIEVGNILFTTGGWMLAPGSGALAYGATGPIVITTSTGTDTIGAAIVDGSSFATGGGATSLIKLGAGTLILGGANTYSGSTTISAGILQISSDANLGIGTGAGNVVVNGGTLLATANMTLGNGRGVAIGPNSGIGSGTLDAASGQTLIFGGVIGNNTGGIGDLIKGPGGGTLVLGGVNTYSGSTTILGGTLAISSDGNLGLGTGVGNVVLDGGTLLATASMVLDNARGIAVGPNGGAGNGALDVAGGQTLIFNGVIADNPGGIGSLVKGPGAGTLILGGVNTYTGGTIVLGGTLIIAAAGALASVSTVDNSAQLLINANSIASAIAGAGGTTVNANLTASSIMQGSLTVNGTVAIAATPLSSGPGNRNPNAATNVVGALNISGGLAPTGTLNLNNNTLIISNGGAAARDAAAADIAYARNGGLWNRPGIASTNAQSAFAAAHFDSQTLGIALNSDLPTPYSTFGGQPVSPNDVLIAFTYGGDANLDGSINSNDYFAIDRGFFDHYTGWVNGDFNYDGTVNGNDYFIIDSNFIDQSGMLAAPEVRAHAAEFGPSYLDQFTPSQLAAIGVPEPGSLLLLGLSVMGLLAPRVRRAKW